MLSFSFNGIRKDYIHMLRGRKRPPWPSLTRNILTVPGRPGGYLQGTEIQPRIIEVPIVIEGQNISDLQKLKEDLASWLVTDEPKELVFDDEPDRTYYAVVDETIDFDEIAYLGQGTIRFICPDPYKYGPEKEAIFPSDVVSLPYNGTAPGDPVFELEATQPVTFAMVSDGEHYNMIGRPADVDVDVVNERILKLEERGETLNEWTTSGARVDGTVSGQFGTDGTGITVLNYGTGPRWHGPALIREIAPIQDFEIEMQCRVDTSQPNQTFRIEFYLFDEYMNDIGKMAVVDNSDKLIFFVAEGRYGPFVAPHVNYAISSRNYQIRERHFHGMLRMKRIGQRFEFYVARMGSGETPRHFDTLTQVFNDVNNEYQGKLRYVLIHIGKFSGTGSPNVPRINSFKVYEHIQVNEDQTPYIAYPGDIITFDHATKDILVNGESRKDLKDFGARFFRLQKGENQFVVLPANSFAVRVKYRERFL